MLGIENAAKVFEAKAFYQVKEMAIFKVRENRDKWNDQTQVEQEAALQIVCCNLQMVSNGLLSLWVLDLDEELENNVDAEDQFKKCVSDENSFFLKIDILLRNKSEIKTEACQVAACLKELPDFKLVAVHRYHQVLEPIAQPMPILFVCYHIDDASCFVIVFDSGKDFKLGRQRS